MWCSGSRIDLDKLLDRRKVRNSGSRVWSLGFSELGPGMCLDATKGPMWGYPRLVLGALGSFLEPFCGHVLLKVDKLCSN